MTKFKITYKSGVVEEFEQSDCSTIEQLVNVKFGSADYKSNGVEVELINETKLPVEADSEQEEESESDEEVKEIIEVHEYISEQSDENK